jgi:hypothetical protein
VGSYRSEVAVLGYDEDGGRVELHGEQRDVLVELMKAELQKRG